MLKRMTCCLQDGYKSNNKFGLLTIPSASSSSKDDPMTDDSRLIAQLRAKLDQQELLWTAEKATLEEYYEAGSRNLQEAVVQLQQACNALRRENDGQLQLLQSSRRALCDLRNRYDLGVVSWADDRQRLEATFDQVLSKVNSLIVNCCKCAYSVCSGVRGIPSDYRSGNI